MGGFNRPRRFAPKKPSMGRTTCTKEVSIGGCKLRVDFEFSADGAVGAGSIRMRTAGGSRKPDARQLEQIKEQLAKIGFVFR